MGVGGFVAEDLENLGDALDGRKWHLRCAALEAADEFAETSIIEADVAAPICPGCFVVLVVVGWSEVLYGMHEAKDEAVGSPVDDDVNGHVVGVKSDLGSL